MGHPALDLGWIERTGVDGDRVRGGLINLELTQRGGSWVDTAKPSCDLKERRMTLHIG